MNVSSLNKIINFFQKINTSDLTQSKAFCCNDYIAQLVDIYFQNKNMAEVRKQEFELLETRSVPMRHYLMKYVMPTVIQGLMDCCKVKPDDPVEFLVTLLIDFISHVLFNNYSIFVSCSLYSISG